MCNINVIIKKDKKPSHLVTECMNAVTYMSFKSNDDGEGFFNEKYKVKTSVEKIIYKGNHSMLVTHQRYSTSGKVPEMTQPLENEDFIIVHNGMFYGLGREKKSDTAQYLFELSKEYKKTGDLLEALKTLNYRTDGYYSVVIYNKADKSLTYYKSYQSDMFMVQTDDYLLMSTSKQNALYMKRFFKIEEELMEIEDGKFYDMLDNMDYLGDFLEKPYRKPPTNTNTRFRDRQRSLPRDYSEAELCDMSASELALLDDESIEEEEDEWEDWCYLTEKQKTAYRNKVYTKVHILLKFLGVSQYTFGLHSDAGVLSVFAPTDCGSVCQYFNKDTYDLKYNKIKKKYTFSFNIQDLYSELIDAELLEGMKQY